MCSELLYRADLIGNSVSSFNLECLLLPAQFPVVIGRGPYLLYNIQELWSKDGRHGCYTLGEGGRLLLGQLWGEGPFPASWAGVLN